MSEILQSRILGAIRFVDISTNGPVRRPLALSADKLKFVRNRTGDYAIVRADHPDLLKHIEGFRTVPAEPAEPVSFAARVKDPGGDYLPRDFVVKLPRDPNPDHASNVDSLFRPVEVLLLSAPSRPVAPNWCAMRFTVVNQTGVPIEHAAVRVSTTNPAQTVFGMTNAIGEALVALAGLPFHTISQDPGDNSELVSTEVDATYEVFAHKQGGAAWPELIAANDNNLVKTDSVTVKAAPGREIKRKVVVTIP
jgi:hypothetical protein